MVKMLFLILGISFLPSGFAMSESPAPKDEILVNSIGDKLHIFSCWYGRHYVNVTAFDGPDGTLLVDSDHRKSAQGLKNALTEMGLSEPTYIINTHFHGDHTGGNETFGATATIIAHENVRKRMTDELDDSLLKKSVALPDEVFTDSVTFSFNGDTVRVIHMPDGHTDNDAIVHFLGGNIVCLGDLLFSDELPHIFKVQGGSLEGFIRNLGLIIDMFPDDATFVPGHGRPYNKSELRKYRDMLADLTERIRAEFRSGKSIEEVFAADVLNEWRDWVNQEYLSVRAFVLVVWDNDRTE